MITRLNPRRIPVRKPRTPFFWMERALVVFVALLAANTIGCNNLSLAPRSIITISGITAGQVKWSGNAVTRETPKVSLSLQPGSAPVNYFQGEAQFYLPNGVQAQLPAAKFPFSVYLALQSSEMSAQPLTKEFSIDGLITRELIDYSSRQNKTPESYDVTAVTVLTGQNIHGDTIRTIVRVPIVFNYE
ncbi:MAG: hypothetical protein ACM3YO_03925 [Bacteroidota bacterium]